MEQVKIEMPIGAFIPDDFWNRYAAESRAIEGENPSEQSAVLLRAFVEGPLSVETLCDYVYGEAGAKIRSEGWMNVRVGSHVCPPGGPHIVTALEEMISGVMILDMYEFHTKFLHLHPFMDGNGRAARAILAWAVLRNLVWRTSLLKYPVLQAIYYMGLDFADRLIDTGKV